ncbi:aspartyl/asparaginyl beta-hydroxylase domain-containing protein [Curvibacter sp. RS43]|uniref:aspartyl/asparaginyl beta-hydroxylase domain-containing protein n=1 Tax=Curvibacter microcysteis TaxID=3026419 RepID=UPI002362F7C4|nr:aspartyl/asparaginyl beta-hydroxylase domain-containing protein [Curvibacter sp. RS43]MDD0809772.1 aspartyl/asparaginyl beta-hydroxylase domain-containing protein [Curvibacter sp. RS43]
MKWAILSLFVLTTLVVHFRGRVRLGAFRQITDHSTFFAPVNVLLYSLSQVPNQPYLAASHFPEMQLLVQHWQAIRDEGLHLAELGRIKASDGYNDIGFNSFFRTGWKRFYLKWYDQPHPSAQQLCPVTVGLLQQVPSVKAAMFAHLPPGARLVRHRDPYAGSIRFHLGLATPNDERCFIEVDGQRYSWRDGEAVFFDETYLHHAENQTEQDRLILFCDVERPVAGAWLRAFNRWFGRHVVGAASSPNTAVDHTGGLNRFFAVAYLARVWGKGLKARNRTLYYLLKWLILGGLLALLLWV